MLRKTYIYFTYGLSYFKKRLVLEFKLLGLASDGIIITI